MGWNLCKVHPFFIPIPHHLSRKESIMRIFINPGHALGGRPDPGAVNL